MNALALKGSVRRGRRTVLHDVDLEVHPGELLALVGPNGAGKSSLLAALTGDLPVAGTVTCDDLPLTSWRPRDLARRRAVLLQQSTVAFSFTARDVVAMGRAPWGPDDTVVAQALADAGVHALAERPVTSLSGGEQALVAFARLLAQATDLVLLDEPTAALDLAHAEAVMHHLATLTRSGRGVVTVLHDLNLAAAYADRIALISGGRLVALGRPDEVLTPDILSPAYGHPVDVVPHPRTGRPLVLPYR